MPGLAPWAILISSCSAFTRNCGVTPKRPLATCRRRPSIYPPSQPLPAPPASPCLPLLLEHRFVLHPSSPGDVQPSAIQSTAVHHLLKNPKLGTWDSVGGGESTCLMREEATSPDWRPMRWGKVGDLPCASTSAKLSHRAGSSPPSPLLLLPA